MVILLHLEGSQGHFQHTPFSIAPALLTISISFFRILLSDILCFSIGRGYGNLLSYGIFNSYKTLGTLYVDPLVYFLNGKTEAFNPLKITEEIDYSWFSGNKSTYVPFEEDNGANMNKPNAYTWIKAARYENLPFETGPLARQWLSGEYRHGISTMDRTIARALEAKKTAEVLKILLDNVVPDISLQSNMIYRRMPRAADLLILPEVP